MQFTITSAYTKVRLDKFLKEHFPEFSRARLQKLIEAGSVTVDGKRVPVHYFLRAGDEVEAVIEAPQELRVTPNPEVQFKVLHEGPDFMVVNKPAGLVVHQGQGHKASDTLVNGLLARYSEIARVGDDLIRPGIVHRLDADVSGVMVVARTQDMFDHLKRQFKLHEVEKEYVAVVQGKVSPPEGTIEFAVARKGAKMVARPKGAEGRRAITEFETIGPIGHISPIGPITLLQIHTRTGRTHQIRVHLQAIGNPIVGDRLYGGARGQGLGASRLLLHARRLIFKDVKGKRKEFVVEPPKEFKINP